MISNPIGVIIGILLLMVTGNAFAIDCVPLDPREQVSKETENDIRVAVETLFKIGKIEAEYARRVKEEATLIYKDHPNYDQLVLKSKLIYLFCETLENSGFSGEEQLKRLLDFTNVISPAPGPAPGPSQSAYFLINGFGSLVFRFGVFNTANKCLPVLSVERTNNDNTPQQCAHVESAWCMAFMDRPSEGASTDCSLRKEDCETALMLDELEREAGGTRVNTTCTEVAAAELATY